VGQTEFTNLPRAGESTFRTTRGKKKKKAPHHFLPESHSSETANAKKQVTTGGELGRAEEGEGSKIEMRGLWETAKTYY